MGSNSRAEHEGHSGPVSVCPEICQGNLCCHSEKFRPRLIFSARIIVYHQTELVLVAQFISEAWVELAVLLHDSKRTAVKERQGKML